MESESDSESEVAVVRVVVTGSFSTAHSLVGDFWQGGGLTCGSDALGGVAVVMVTVGAMSGDMVCFCAGSLFAGIGGGGEAVDAAGRCCTHFAVLAVVLHGSTTVSSSENETR